jgi:RNA polymerase sigma-70 factor (ECF subfamily)
VDAYGPLVYHWGRLRGLQDADAADVTQEVLLRVAQCVRNFEYQPDRGRFRDWLGTVTRHKVLRILKQNGRAISSKGGEAEELFDRIPAPKADAEWTAEFNAHMLRTALDRVRPDFEPATWLTFERVWLDDRPAEEVAVELGVSIQVVYTTKSRVLKRLKEEIQHLAEDLPQLVPLS